MIVRPDGKPVPRSVFLTVPNGGTLTTATSAYIMQLAGTAANHGINVRLCFPPKSNSIDDSRNRTVDDFRQTPCGWYVTIDADTQPTKSIWPLLALNRPVIGLPYPIFNETLDPPFAFCAWDEVDGKLRPHRPTDGLQRVDMVGAGCLIIRRDVLLHPLLRAPFMSDWGDHGERAVSSDLAFCRRVREAEFELYTHYDYPCRHYTTVELLSMATAYGRKISAPVATSA